MTKLYMLAGLIWLSTAVAFGQNIDTLNSKVNFSIKHMKWKTAEGTFSGMHGEVKFNENDLGNSFFRVCIETSSVNTGNEKRDKKLRGENFFQTDTFPDICFKSTEIRSTTQGYFTRGKLSMLGITRETEINFVYSNKQFSGKLELNRFDYNLGNGTSSLKLGEEVTIEIICFLK